MFFVYFRNTFYASATNVRRPTLQGAVDAGVADGRPFDVLVESGAVAWVWNSAHVEFLNQRHGGATCQL